LSAGAGRADRLQAARRRRLRLPDQPQGAADGRAADRLDERRLEAGRLQGRVPRAAAGDHPQADQERRRHHPGRGGSRRAGGGHHQRGRLHGPAAAEPGRQDPHAGQEGRRRRRQNRCKGRRGEEGSGQEGRQEGPGEEGGEEGPGTAQDGLNPGARHRGHLPEVTSCIRAIASGLATAEHGRMRRILAPLLQPLPVAGLLTIFTVGYALLYTAPAQRGLALLLLAGFLLLFVSLNLMPERWRRAHDAVLVAMVPAVLVLASLSYRGSASQVLLVI